MFDISAPARDVLASLSRAHNWDAWRGALIMYAGRDLQLAADKAGVDPGEFEYDESVHHAYHDASGLRTSCKRTAAWLARWVNRQGVCKLNHRPDNAVAIENRGSHFVNVISYSIGD